MRESVFVSEVTASLKANGVWAYKIADAPTSWIKDRIRFTPTKPCDVIFCMDGRFGAIECKQLKSWKAFGPGMMRPAQVQALNELTSMGAKTWVFLNIRVARTTNWLIAFHWTQLQELWSTKKTIRAKILKELPHVEGRRGLFDLGFL